MVNKKFVRWIQWTQQIICSEVVIIRLGACSFTGLYLLVLISGGCSYATFLWPSLARYFLLEKQASNRMMITCIVHSDCRNEDSFASQMQTLFTPTIITSWNSLQWNLQGRKCRWICLEVSLPSTFWNYTKTFWGCMKKHDGNIYEYHPWFPHRKECCPFSRQHWILPATGYTLTWSQCNFSHHQQNPQLYTASMQCITTTFHESHGGMETQTTRLLSFQLSTSHRKRR